MEQARILIVSDDAEFVNSLAQCWQRLSCGPEYSVSSVLGLTESPTSVVVVMDGAEALVRVADEVLLAIAITDELMPVVGGTARRVVQIRRNPGWAEIAAALAHETVLRVGALRRVEEIEHRLRESERFAVLGHFICEARHGLGNALTSVLGNAELLLLESNSGLRDVERRQLETIHAMSLKIYETLQRLSSLDMELQVAERQAERKTLQC